MIKRNVSEFPKFDCIVGNPPFQDSNKKSKNSGLWVEFIKKSMKLTSNYVAFITPISWMSGSTSQKGNLIDLYIKNLKYLNLDTKKYFPNINSTFCDYILDINGSAETKVVQNSIEYHLNLNNIGLIPNKLNDISFSIIKKFLFSDRIKLGFSTKQRVTPVGYGKYSILHTNGEIKLHTVDAKNSGIYKICVNKSGYLNPTTTILGTSQNIYWAEINKTESDSVVLYMNSNIIKAVTQRLCKYSGFNSDTVMNNIPKLNFDRTYTDDDLYKEFGLTQEEIDYIENNVR